MKKCFYLVNVLILIGCYNSVRKSISIQSGFYPDQYQFEYVVERLNNNRSVINSGNKIQGYVLRDKGKVVSKSGIGLGIAEDSLCLFIDDSLKIITLDKRSAINPRMLVPFYDPQSILEYAKKYNKSFSRNTEDSITTYKFEFSSDPIPLQKIRIQKNLKNNTSIIEIIYQILNDSVNEKIAYYPTNKYSFNEKMADYIEKRNNKFELIQNNKEYVFFDGTGINSILKK